MTSSLLLFAEKATCMPSLTLILFDMRHVPCSQGTDEVEAIVLNYYTNGSDTALKNQSFTCEEFSSLSELRYLQMHGADLVGDFEHHFSKLRWLSWKNCPPDFLATNFHPRNLVVLDLSWSKITHKWKGWKQIEVT